MKLKFKQLLACVIAAVMFAGLFAVNTAANAADDIRVMLDGEELTFDVAPQIVDERTMVPMRAIFEALGATVEWDDETRTVTATRGETVVVMQVGNYSMYVDGNEIVLDVAPFIEDDRTLVMARAVAEGLDADVQWDGEARVVTITSAVVEDENNDEEDEDADEEENEQEEVAVADDDDDSIEAIAQIRHVFEQRWLPQMLYEIQDTVSLMLPLLTIIPPEEMSALRLLEDIIREEWRIITNLADVDVGPEHIVSVEFEQLGNNTNAIIIEMLHINRHSISTHIGIVHNPAVGLRYFTLEQSLDMFGTGNPPFMFSHVLISPDVWERGGIHLIENTREAFIDAIRAEMNR